MMDTRLKELIKEYDNADFQLFMAEDMHEKYRFTEVDKAKFLQTRENIFKQLYEKYGVTRDSWGDLYMPDGTPIPMED